MNVHKIKLHIGLEKPVHIAHITDVHLCCADNRDAHLLAHAEERTHVFYKEAGCIDETPYQCFAAGLDYAGNNCDLTVITGDVFDFISQANFDAVDAILKNKDYMFTAGNHEFCPRVGTPDSRARKGDIFHEIQAHFKGNMHFEARIVNGLNIVTMDNGYYNYSALQVKALKKEIEKELPIVLFSHVPLTEPILNMERFHKDLIPDAYMMEQTNAMLDLIASTKLIKASFAGHWHFGDEAVFRAAVPEYVTPGMFKNEMTHIVID